jgi:hypothetical protein
VNGTRVPVKIFTIHLAIVNAIKFNIVFIARTKKKQLSHLLEFLTLRALFYSPRNHLIRPRRKIIRGKTFQP